MGRGGNVVEMTTKRMLGVFVAVTTIFVVFIFAYGGPMVASMNSSTYGHSNTLGTQPAAFTFPVHQSSFLHQIAAE